ncbi:MAG: hypothetical protein A2297_05505, partial [Elusimicrobia bacterium RIFOXYB2_FULL_48_7]
MPISTGYWYQDRYFRFCSSHTAIPSGNFTSSISSGAGKLEYYRVWWGTSAVYTMPMAGDSPTGELKWGASYYSLSPSTHADQQGIPIPIPSGFNLALKPAILLSVTLNRDSWYFHCASYNGDNEISTSVVLGPYFFNGAPSPITDLAVTPSIVEEGSVVLTWTAPTADATFSNITSGKYYLKYNGTIILNDNIFNASPGLIITTGSFSPGEKHTRVITGLNPGQPYCFAVKTEDNAQNVSEYIMYVVQLAAKVAKISVTDVAPKTFYASKDYSSYALVTIQTQDSGNNPLKLAANSVVYLYSDSSKGSFSKDLVDWTPSPGSVQLLKGEYLKQFYYADEQSGAPVISCDEFPDLSWAVGTTSLTVIPGLATAFRVTHAGSGVIQRDSINGTIEAVDEFGNRSDKYLGNIISTSTPGEQRINPSTNTFLPEDLGLKNVVFTNNYIAGPAYARVEEATDETYKDAYFYDTNTGWAVGDKGSIRKTGNGGTSWISQVYGTTTARGLFSVHFPAGYVSTGWAAGKSGLIVRTTDSGMSWSEQASGTAEDLNTVFFISPAIGFAAGTSGKIIKTTNGGTTWANSSTGISGAPELTSIYIIGASSVGWVVGKGGAVYQTTDNGASWVNQSALFPGLAAKDLFSVKFMDFDAAMGFVTGSSGAIYKTSNSGAAWAQQTSLTSQIIYDIDFNDPNAGITAGAGGALLRTADGGTTWVVGNSTKTFYAASFRTNAFVLGTDGCILKSADQGQTWTKFAMQGISDPLYWNGTVLTPVSATTKPLVQGKSAQDICLFGVRTHYGDLCTWRGLTVQKTGTVTDDAVGVRLYRDNGDRLFNKNNDAFKAQGTFSAGISSLTFSDETVTQSTGYYFIVYDVSFTAKVGETLGLTIPQDAFSYRIGDIPFARNNLPYTFNPSIIVPSSTTIIISYSDLSGNYAPGGISSAT